MNDQNIRTEATLALTRLLAASAQDEYIVVMLMKDACDNIGTGDEGAHGLKRLVDLWRALDFSEIDGNTISELRTAAVASDSTANMKRASAAVDKGDFGALAVNGLCDLWRELKLGEIDGEALSELTAVVHEMYGKLESRACGAIPRKALLGKASSVRM